MRFKTRVMAIALISILTLLFILWLALNVQLPPIPAYSGPYTRQSLIVSTSFVAPTVVATPTASSAPASGDNTAIPVALIGLISAVVVALIAAIPVYITIYQGKQKAQKGTEKATRESEKAAADTNTPNTKGSAEKAKKDDLQTYRDGLHADSRIARLQILDMSRPLEVTDIYIQVRLHQESRPGYALDAALYDRETLRNPNALLKANQLQLESRVSTAIDPDEAIRKYRRCIIVGDPGAGKTTLLKYLALKSIDGALHDLPDLPIHIELNTFATSRYIDLLEFAAATWEERYNISQAEALNLMKTRLQEGNALLLIDALDETVTGTTKETAEASYRAVAGAIAEVATLYHRSPVVVTARKAGYYQRSRLTGFTELEVLDFRPEDIKQFVARWFACHPNPQKRANASDLNDKLERNPRIHALAANPLLLSLIVIVYEDQLDLPDRRAELYKRCVDTLLTKWDTSRDIRRRREFKPEHKQLLLEEIAWHFHLQGERYFTEDDVLLQIANFLPIIGLKGEQSQEILEEIAAENGLLKEQAHGWYGFLHLTLQEYFAALYAVEHTKVADLLEHRGDPWWEEVILLYAGRAPDISPLLRQLLGMRDEKASVQKKVRDDVFHTNLLLAGRCLAARPSIREVPLRQEVIDRLFKLLTITCYNLDIEHSAEVLAEIGGTAVNASLLQLLEDEQLSWSVRCPIAEALGQLGDRSVTPDLLPLLANEQLDEEVHRFIAAALGQLGDHSVAPDLLSLLTNGQLDASVQRSIATALGQLGNRSVIPDLLHLLTNERLDTWVRQSIATALSQLGDRSIAPDLLRLLTNERLDKRVCGSIADALGQLGDRSVIPDLLQLLTDEQLNEWVRGSIATALGQLGDHSVIPNLLRLLTNGQLDTWVRRSIATALGQLGDRSIVPDLLPLLTNEQLNEWVRGSIATALGQLGDHAIVPDLLPLLTNEQLNEWVRGSIADALEQLGDRSIVSSLLRLLQNHQINNSVRRSIANALGQLGDRSIVSSLLRLLQNHQIDNSVRWSIAAALGQLGDRSVIPDLLPLLANGQLNVSVRESIATTLSQLVQDQADLYKLAALLAEPSISDTVYSAVWQISSRIGVRVFKTNQGKIKIEKMP